MLIIKQLSIIQQPGSVNAGIPGIHNPYQTIQFLSFAWHGISIYTLCGLQRHFKYQSCGVPKVKV